MGEGGEVEAVVVVQPGQPARHRGQVLARGDAPGPRAPQEKVCPKKRDGWEDKGRDRGSSREADVAEDLKIYLDNVSHIIRQT